MFFHGTRLSLSCPFILAASRQRNEPNLSSQVRMFKDHCEQSVDSVVSLLKRFRIQHGLRHVPLVFLHGVVAAINAVILLGRDMDQDQPSSCLLRERLPDLELALEEMSPTWTIAKDVSRRLEVLKQRHAGQTPSFAVRPGDPDTSIVMDGDRLGFHDPEFVPAYIRGNDPFLGSWDFLNDVFFESL
jgi:hypothetical protein